MKLKEDSVKEDINDRYKQITNIVKIIITVLSVAAAVLCIIDVLIGIGRVSYTFVVLLITTLFIILISYVSIVVAKKISCVKAKFLLIISSALCKLLALVASFFIIFSFFCYHPFESCFAHFSYHVTDFLLGSHDEIPLDAISTAITNDMEGKPKYYAERGDLYVKIYDNLKEEEYLYNAINDYNVALLVDPENGEYAYGRGLAYKYIGEIDKAKADLRFAYESNRDNDDYLLEYGRITAQDGDRTGLKLIKEYVDMYRVIIAKEYRNQFVLMVLQDMDDKMLQIEETGFSFRLNKVYLQYGDRNHLDEGVRKTESLIELLRNNPDFVNEMLEEMEESVDKDDATVGLIYEYSVLLQSVDKYNEALQYIDKLLEKYPTYLRAYRIKGNILMKLGRYEEAWKCLNVE